MTEPIMQGIKLIKASACLALLIGTLLSLASNAHAAAYSTDIVGKVAPPSVYSEACVFFAPSGASNLGHVGWGFRDDASPDHWFYGATENLKGNFYLPPDPNHDNHNLDQRNYAWFKDGTWTKMLSDFVGPIQIQHRTTWETYQREGYYTQFRCKETLSSNVTAAVQVALTLRNQGFQLPNNDCEAHTMQVLTTYDETTFTTGADHVDKDQSSIPAIWFSLLGVDDFDPTSNL